MVTIRPAEPRDAAEVTRVHVTGWQRAYVGMVPQGYLDAMDPADTERIRTWHDRLADRESPSRTLVAVSSPVPEEVWGFVSFGPYRVAGAILDDTPPGAGEVYAIYLEPDRVGTGLGRALMDAALAGLAEQGLTPVRLWALAANTRSLGFYHRYGFRPDGGRSTYTVEQPGELAVQLADVRLTLRPEWREPG
jgi:ribosomal protein S18 acetylase RimI-like enzyme